MKKKGLIVATIVMVLVLAVSLTTATYAWFTNTGSATVEDIAFSVTAASDLVIGVKADNTYKASPLWSDFYSDGTEYNATNNTWTGDTQGLGLSVDTGLQLNNITQAVYSFTTSSIVKNPADHATAPNAITSATATTYTRGGDERIVATGFDKSQTALKASGNGSTITGGYEAAVKNTDYLDVVFGVAAAKPEVLTFGCLISIDNSEALSALGMNAAIHVIYSVNGGTYYELDVYGTHTAGDANSSVDAPTAPTVNLYGKSITYVSKYTDTNTETDVYSKGDAQVWIPLRDAAALESATDYAETGAAGIVQLHLIIYICGPDSDCITAATGTGATISIEFINTNKSMYTEAPAIGA